MRRTALMFAVLAAVAVTALGGASAAGSAPQPTITTGETHRFAVHFSRFFFTDADRNGRPSKGDDIVFNDLLFAGGRQVGHDGGSCIIVNDAQLLASCTGTIELAGGQISFQ